MKETACFLFGMILGNVVVIAIHKFIMPNIRFKHGKDRQSYI